MQYIVSTHLSSLSKAKAEEHFYERLNIGITPEALEERHRLGLSHLEEGDVTTYMFHLGLCINASLRILWEHEAPGDNEWLTGHLEGNYPETAGQVPYALDMALAMVNVVSRYANLDEALAGWRWISSADTDSLLENINWISHRLHEKTMKPENMVSPNEGPIRQATNQDISTYVYNYLHGMVENQNETALAPALASISILMETGKYEQAVPMLLAAYLFWINSTGTVIQGMLDHILTAYDIPLYAHKLNPFLVEIPEEEVDPFNPQ